ncbi:MAG TPA: diguanylate cyclase, partial [Povalibacter sp.]|nr:diguanylate cyclase [Povalibacter sp.]
VARLGGDEFIALAYLSHDTSALCQRLRDQLNLLNASAHRPYTLDVSIGTAIVDLANDDDIDALIARADAAMYEEKRTTRRRAGD